MKSTSGKDNFFPLVVGKIWEEYERNLKNQKSADFDDLISKTVFLFQDHPEILEKYQNKWRYILIDEYQDTNHAQYVFSKMLAKKFSNICAVGDEDQSIYKFRGANFGNILNFEKDWPDVKIIMLEQNYRSTQKILEAANAVIRQNKLRKPKNLFSQLGKGGGLILFDAMNEKEEASLVATASEELITNGADPGQISVLYRANFQSRNLEEAFLNKGLPYQVIGTKFFERKEVKDIIAYIKASLNPDDIISLERIINEPPRGIGKASLLNYFAGKKMAPDKQAKIKDFFELLKKIKKELRQKPPSKAILFIIKNSSYEKHLKDGSEEGIMRYENLNELANLALKYDKMDLPTGIEKLLEDVALLSDQDNINSKQKAIRFMTVHAAKGLEFSNVFVTGLEEGLFPYSRFGEPDESEEERRLFYVAITRAKERLFLSFAYSRNLFGGRQMNKPSRFIEEIPPELFSGQTRKNFDLPITNYLEI